MRFLAAQSILGEMLKKKEEETLDYNDIHPWRNIFNE